jgi:hypothetical protein
MPAIYFRFTEAEGDGDRPPEQVVVTVWPVVLDDLGSALDPAIVESKSVAITYDRFSASEPLILPAGGTYVIEVNLPEGRRVRRTVTLKDDNHDFLILRESQSSTNNSLKYAKPVVANVVAASRRSGIASDVARLRCVISPVPMTKKGLSDLSHFLATLASQPGEAVASDVPDRSNSKQLFHLPTLAAPASFSQHYKRRWLVVNRKGKDEALIAYPAEWRTLDQQPAFKFYVERDKDGVSSLSHLSSHLTLVDPFFASAVAYLHRRDWHSCMAVLDQRDKLPAACLADWRNFPFETATRAYASALGSDDDQNSVDWLHKVRTAFDWLPDGLIAYGWQQLRNGESGTPAWREARLSLLKSTECGLPYFSIGLRLLIDGLTLLSMGASADSEVKKALASATAADFACAHNEPFTTLQIQRFKRLDKRASDHHDNGRLT